MQVSIPWLWTLWEWTNTVKQPTTNCKNGLSTGVFLSIAEILLTASDLWTDGIDPWCSSSYERVVTETQWKKQQWLSSSKKIKVDTLFSPTNSDCKRLSSDMSFLLYNRHVKVKIPVQARMWVGICPAAEGKLGMWDAKPLSGFQREMTVGRIALLKPTKGVVLMVVTLTRNIQQSWNTSLPPAEWGLNQALKKTHRSWVFENISTYPPICW